MGCQEKRDKLRNHGVRHTVGSVCAMASWSIASGWPASPRSSVRGELVATLPQFQEAVLRADVQPMTGLTPYARYGNYPVVVAALVLLAFAYWRRAAHP